MTSEACEMGIITRLLTYLAHEVRISKEDMYRIVDGCDTDGDGYISVAEVYDVIHAYVQIARGKG